MTPVKSAALTGRTLKMLVSRQERFEVRTNPDRPDTRAAAAMSDAKCFVQVEVGDIVAETPGPCQPDQCV